MTLQVSQPLLGQEHARCEADAPLTAAKQLCFPSWVKVTGLIPDTHLLTYDLLET